MNLTLSGRGLCLCFALAVGCALSAGVLAQEANYPSADAAAKAFVDALRNNDKVALAKVLGANWKDYIPTDGIDRSDVDVFLARFDEAHRIDGDAKSGHLAVGKDDWTLPIPIVQGPSGWHFDVKTAQGEIRTRHIGANELATEKAMLAYYDAQRDFASKDRMGDGVLQYAQKFMSTQGKHDGLYWPVSGDEPESPLGPLFAEVTPGQGYHGYRYRILTAQGPSAPGGAYNYIVGGRMTSGFALVAWPIKYGETGVMTFMVSHDGETFEKDLGKDTDKLVQTIKRFDPDSSWEEVKDDEK
ncbi:DUF2950 domain-containing protein [Dyella halodurans]|uniref:DUF2950 domain-containing protein n=1 Tax=Dyella halodurans TaxID=1920171 RepID=A0ABV9C2K3_9GAMM|nr:DUF2950 domain-containing protein [Dyella halodurans]